MTKRRRFRVRRKKSIRHKRFGLKLRRRRSHRRYRVSRGGIRLS